MEHWRLSVRNDGFKGDHRLHWYRVYQYLSILRPQSHSSERGNDTGWAYFPQESQEGIFEASLEHI